MEKSELIEILTAFGVPAFVERDYSGEDTFIANSEWAKARNIEQLCKLAAKFAATFASSSLREEWLRVVKRREPERHADLGREYGNVAGCVEFETMSYFRSTLLAIPEGHVATDDVIFQDFRAPTDRGCDQGASGWFSIRSSLDYLYQRIGHLPASLHRDQWLELGYTIPDPPPWRTSWTPEPLPALVLDDASRAQIARQNVREDRIVAADAAMTRASNALTLARRPHSGASDEDISAFAAQSAACQEERHAAYAS